MLLGSDRQEKLGMVFTLFLLAWAWFLTIPFIVLYRRHLIQEFFDKKGKLHWGVRDKSKSNLKEFEEECKRYGV